MRLRLLYVTRDKDRHGNVRIYLRRPGQPKIRLHAQPGSAAFLEEYRRASDGPPKEPPPSLMRTCAPAGSLDSVVKSYYASPEWSALSEGTRKPRRRFIDALCQRYGDRPAHMLERKHIRALRDEKAETPHAADNWMKAMKGLFRFAVDAEILERDPTDGIRKIGRTAEGYRPWSIEDVRRFEARHPLGTTPRLALALLLYTGQRRSDAVRLGPQHVQKAAAIGEGVRAAEAEFLCFVQAKNSERNPSRIEIPILPPLREAIGAMERIGASSFLLSRTGRPYSKEGFGNVFRDWCDEAGLKGLSAHGLRKAAGAAMAESGCTEREIMAVLGHRAESSVRIYVRSADKRRLATSALHKTEVRLSHPNPEADSGTKSASKALKSNAPDQEWRPRQGSNLQPLA